MSFHGSGIDEYLYDSARAAMFGQSDLGEYGDDLDEKDEFIRWAIEENDFAEWFQSEADAISLLGAVYDHEVAQYREEQAEVDA